MSTILEQIIARKHEEIALAKSQVSETTMQARAQSRTDSIRDFYAAVLRDAAQKGAVIAEIKRASPSKGLLRDPFNVTAIAQSYALHGATCLSVLTDQDFFQGHWSYLDQVRATVPLPILRKDFTVHPYQIYEARTYGADAILLIVACLSDAQLRELCICALGLGLTVLIEVHDALECQRALPLLQTGVLLGVNNRNLHSFVTDIKTSVALKKTLPPSTFIVAESGISSSADVQYLRSHGIHAFLIGESFMRANDPGTALTQLMRPT